MNISLDLQKITLSNLFFLERKTNIIMDGNFTKLMYSTEWFTLNGLYILFPVELTSVEKNTNKSFIRINPYHPGNLSIIQDFSKIELRILEQYKHCYRSKAKISNYLSKQLYSGTVKIYKDYYSVDVKKPNPQYMIKISGVWETADNIGLTYKLIEVTEVSTTSCSTTSTIA